MKTILASVLFTTLVLQPFVSPAQREWKNWNTAQLNFSLSKKTDLRISHLRAFNISNGFSNDFNQSSIHLSYDITKKWDINAGYTFGGSISLSDGGSRVSVKTGYKVKIADALNWTNSIQGEIHSKNETRYHHRVIFGTRVSPKKRLNFLKLSPSAAYSLYYNIGGNPLQYYDSKTGAPTVKQTPDGFHRGRFTFTLNSKLSGVFSLSVFYMTQREFNLFTPENRRMNIIKPTNGKIIRPFDDFNVAGLTLTCDLDLYRAKK
ncbi:MAG: DUF2490 domain-containing protein [Sphingobacteriales bacterium]|nr:DUF2490 domain-containing protein [Sphingobacteriales bacterium]